MNEQASNLTAGYRWLLWVVGTVVLVADQWSKNAIINWLAIGESWRPLNGTALLELFAFTHTKNSGAAFGFFQTGGWFFIIIAIGVCLGITWYGPRLPGHQWWLFVALGLELGGALGNLIDRIRLGVVTDFIHVGSFPIFNIADSAIVSGVVILGWHLWYEEETKKQQARMMGLEQSTGEYASPDGEQEERNRVESSPSSPEAER